MMDVVNMFSFRRQHHRSLQPAALMMWCIILKCFVNMMTLVQFNLVSFHSLVCILKNILSTCLMTSTTVSLIVSRWTASMYVSHIYLSDRKYVIAYDKDPIIKILLTRTAYLNDQDCLIRMLYKDSYWLFQFTSLTFTTRFLFLHLHLNYVLFVVGGLA